LAFCDRFLRACRREPTDCTPIWIMRQAGRYLPGYKALRERFSFFEMCKIPELVVQVTLEPVDRFDLDAAILFSDILIPVEAMGIEVRFVDGEGPVLEKVRTYDDLKALRIPSPPEDIPFVLQALRILRQELEDRIPLIGFAGAPFTLAGYIVEGGASRDYGRLKSMMYREPALFNMLMEKLTQTVEAFLLAQAEAGAQALQLFDSSALVLSPGDYREFVLPYSQAVLRSLSNTGVPLIHFGQGSPHLIDAFAEAGGDVIGVDWRLPLDSAWERIGASRGIQGNLEPFVLFGPEDFLRRRIRDVLVRAGGRPGHIFNLGCGIPPETPIQSVSILVEEVHRFSASWEAQS